MAEYWSTYQLGEISEIQTGPFGSQLHQKDYKPSGTPLLTVENIGINKILKEGLRFVGDFDLKRLNKYTLRKGDILFSRVGSVDRRAYITEAEDGWLMSGSCLRIRVISRGIDSRFLSYLLGTESFKRYINSIAYGATRPSLNTSLLSKVDLKFPPLTDQVRISDILSSLDSKIELNLQMNKTLESIAQSVFKEWFVDFRFPGFDGELINGLPKGWRRSFLGEEIHVAGGSTPSTLKEEFWNGDHHWATPKDLSTLSSPILLTTERKITEEGVKQISSRILPKGTLLLSSRAPIGYMAITEIPTSINQGFIAIQGKTVSTLFMMFWLKRNMNLVLGNANGSTFQEINKANFKRISIIVPAIELLQSFDELVTPVFNRLTLNEIQNQALKQTRDNLLPRLMSGRIRVA
jgi:type I restriction enzyme S subunit